MKYFLLARSLLEINRESHYRWQDLWNKCDWRSHHVKTGTAMGAIKHELLLWKCWWKSSDTIKQITHHLHCSGALCPVVNQCSLISHQVTKRSSHFSQTNLWVFSRFLFFTLNLLLVFSKRLFLGKARAWNKI